MYSGAGGRNTSCIGFSRTIGSKAGFDWVAVSNSTSGDWSVATTTSSAATTSGVSATGVARVSGAVNGDET
ncbi:unannotated protein [freshwater metagenome]|uniref:Unannotated protein n=1 Tax=freshwater metagenome TaxID=449393 RepID=A0A6J7DJQ0_9ZZZZ